MKDEYPILKMDQLIKSKLKSKNNDEQACDTNEKKEVKDSTCCGANF